MSRCPQYCTFENADHTCVRCGLPPRDPRVEPLPAPAVSPEWTSSELVRLRFARWLVGQRLLNEGAA